MYQTIIFLVCDKKEYEETVKGKSVDVLVDFWYHDLVEGIFPQKSIKLDTLLLGYLREAIKTTYQDKPRVEEELSELGVSFSDTGFKINQTVYRKTIELIEAKLQTIDDEDRKAIWDSVLDEFKEALEDVDWDNQVVFVNT